MSRNIFLPVIAAAILTPTFAMAAPATRVIGQIDTVDQTAKTFVIKGWGQATAPTTVTVNDATVYKVPGKIALADLKVGDNITVSGRGIQPGATSVDAGRITLLGADEKLTSNRRGISGTITATTPDLTIKTSYNTTVTVKTTDATQVQKLVDGKWSDVATGKFATVKLSDGATPTATEVDIQAAGGRGGRGGRGNRPQGGGPAPAAAPGA